MARAIFGPNSQTSNPRPSGIPQGTPGGNRSIGGALAGMKGMQVGDTPYLWLLLVIEILAMVGLRRYFRKNHGG